MVQAFIVILLILFSSNSFADRTKEKYKIIEKKIKVHKEKLWKSKKEERSILQDIENVDKKLNKLSLNIIEQRKKIYKINSLSSSTKNELERITQALRKQRLMLRKKIRTIQRFGNSVDRLMLLLNTQDLSELLRMNRYLRSISEYDYRQIERYKETSEKLSEKNIQYRTYLTKLRKSKQKLDLTEGKLTKKKKEREVLLTSIKKDQKLYSSMLKELEKTSRQLKSLIAKAERNIKYKGKGFYNSKGRLPWPVQGNVAIPYGSHKDPRFKTPVFRNGIYLSTKEGVNIKSVHGGRVVFADLFKGLGQVVIINHGMGYHTIYANLSRIISATGDIIRRQDIIGKAGNSGVLNSPGIYFEVRYKGKPTNPLRWLKKK